MRVTVCKINFCLLTLLHTQHTYMLFKVSERKVKDRSRKKEVFFLSIKIKTLFVVFINLLFACLMMLLSQINLIHDLIYAKNLCEQCR